jgi:hypothetical protein
MGEPEAQLFTTITDMRAVPTEKIDAFCEDLRLWLHMHKHIEAVSAESEKVLGVKLAILSPTSAFAWIDDGRHDANINVTIDPATRALLESLRDKAAD